MDLVHYTVPASPLYRFVRGINEKELCKNLQNRGLLRCCTTERVVFLNVCLKQHHGAAAALAAPLPLMAQCEGGSVASLPPLPFASSRGSSSWLEVPGTKKYLFLLSQGSNSRVHSSSLLFQSSISVTNGLRISVCICLLQRDF